jgi:hypothetical protein
VRVPAPRGVTLRGAGASRPVSAHEHDVLINPASFAQNLIAALAELRF